MEAAQDALQTQLLRQKSPAELTLLSAVVNGEEQDVRATLKRYPATANMTAMQGTRTHSLSLVATQGKAGLLKLLLSLGADPLMLSQPLYYTKAPRPEKEDPLIVRLRNSTGSVWAGGHFWGLTQAAYRGAENVMRVYLEDPRVLACIKSDPRPLISAAEGGQEGVLRMLLQHGAAAAINKGHPEDECDGCTPLMTACLHHQLPCAKILIEAGADPLIDRAAIARQPSFREALLARSSDPDQPEAELSRTAMAYVLSCGAVPDFIQLLVSFGARQPTVRKATQASAPHVSRVSMRELPGGVSVVTMKDEPAVAMGEYVAADGSVHSFADLRGIRPQGPSYGLKRATCAACGKAPELGVAHLVCSGCKAVSYCGPACQKEHWKREGGHKVLCKRLQARVASGAGTGMGIDLGTTDEQS